MKIIGIVCIGPDPSVCVMDSGKILSMVEEERITRIKHANVDFPKEAFKFCLNQSGLSLEEIENNTLIGNADQVAAQLIKEIQAIEPCHISLFVQFGSMPQSQVMQSMTQFGDKVLPQLHKHFGDLDSIGTAIPIQVPEVA